MFLKFQSLLGIKGDCDKLLSPRSRFLNLRDFSNFHQEMSLWNVSWAAVIRLFSVDSRSRAIRQVLHSAVGQNTEELNPKKHLIDCDRPKRPKKCSTNYQAYQFPSNGHTQSETWRYFC